MIAIAFLAPSFGSVFAIYGLNAIFQPLTYIFVWRNIVAIEEHPGLLEQFLYWYGSFFFVEMMMFVL